jgi:hypothetical protein
MSGTTEVIGEASPDAHVSLLFYRNRIFSTCSTPPKRA